MKLNLRGRLLAGHILPVLLLLPLIGLALIYLLETGLILPTLANELIEQGLLVSKQAAANPQIWTNPSIAKSIMGAIAPLQPTRFELLDRDNILLATSRNDDRNQVGTTIVNLPPMLGNDSLKIRWAVTPGFPESQLLDAVVPVLDQNGQLLGSVRVFRRLVDVNQQLNRAWMVILGTLLGGLALSGLIAFVLSESFSRPLKQLTHAISHSPLQGQAPLLPEGGVDEIRALIHSYNQLQQRRFELEEDRLRMVANVVHELGRPLGSLQSGLSALRAGAVEDLELRGDLLAGMSERAAHMGRLLEDLTRAFQNPGAFQMAPQPVDLSAWLESQLPIFSEEARQAGVCWEAQIPLGLPITNADPLRLAQALGNLVSNALRYTPAGGSVSLGAWQMDQFVFVNVVDSGPGIPAEEQERIFEPFYRFVRPSWKAAGLGLGLTISRSIARAMGGDVTLQSRPGQGSTFTLRIPLN
jgi:two-component system, OmpR family, sensor histidine kinase BaeS